ncbi:MAG: hypothetical protein FWE53_02900 [Firmicutes bacterium]|nr:hypothetical protein [Bacillota bacterium]
MLIKINNDVHDICSRLKEIDPNYYVVYNTGLGRLEVHYSRQYPNSLACIVPNNRLDSGTITHINCTRKENVDKLIKEMDESNAKLEKENIKSTIENALGKIPLTSLAALQESVGWVLRLS